MEKTVQETEDDFGTFTITADEFRLAGLEGLRRMHVQNMKAAVAFMEELGEFEALHRLVGRPANAEDRCRSCRRNRRECQCARGY